MTKPKMILFDYGQTLCTERWDDPLGGHRAVLAAATENPRHITPEQLEEAYHAMDGVVSRLAEDPWKTGPELCWHAFARAIFESLDLKFDLDYQQLEELHWYERTEPTVAVDYMPELLEFLHREGIRTGVVSNLCFNEKTLRKRIDKCLPDHHFEFIMVSSEYAPAQADAGVLPSRAHEGEAFRAGRVVLRRQRRLRRGRADGRRHAGDLVHRRDAQSGELPPAPAERGPSRDQGLARAGADAHRDVSAAGHGGNAAASRLSRSFSSPASPRPAKNNKPASKGSESSF